MSRLLLAFGLVCATAGVETGARAGAFLLPQGSGQVIAGAAGILSTRRFAANGVLEAAPRWRKASVGGYLEYGVTPRLTALLAPAASGWAGAGSSGPIGSDGSAFGLRYGLLNGAADAVSLQVLLQPPLGHESTTSERADDGARSFGADLRLLYGRCFKVFGGAAFISLEPGGRLRAGETPDELRFDGTFGLHLPPRFMILLQTFEIYSFAIPQIAGPALSAKVSASLVYEFAPAWSLQAGAFRTVAGFNTAAETGPFLSLWHRF